MAIHFEWYETPVAPGKEDKKTLHARVVNNGKVDTDDIRVEIQHRCSLTETDVSAVLDALSHAMGRHLSEGRQVHLDGIGYFAPTLKCTEKVTMETKRKATKVQLKSIRFRPDKELRSEIGIVELKNSKYAGHSNKLSNIEVDIRLKKYFAEHRMMTRLDFQRVCGFMKSTAMAHLRRLKAEGKIQNINLHTQPIYVPVPGYYGVSHDQALTSR